MTNRGFKAEATAIWARRDPGRGVIAVCAWLWALVLLAWPAALGQDSDPGGGGKESEKSEKNEKKTKGKIRVIKQGGYVEYVDPKDDYKDRLPRIPAKGPAESLKTLRVIPGFRVEQVAAEPLVCDAVDIAFDENGRLFVVEMRTYSEAGDTLAGRVSLLEDADGDGKFDSSRVYVDRLMWPTGVTCFGGGIFICSAPDILYCKDTDGDGEADVREVIITGFDTSNPNAFPNSLRWGLDGRIHGMSSTSGGLLRAVKWESGEEGRRFGPVQCRGRDFNFDPRTGEMWLESGGAQFGMTYDEWGCKFESSNSAPIEMVMYEDRYIGRNPYLVAPSPRLGIRQGPNRVYRTSRVEPWRIVRTEMRIAGRFSGPVEGGGTPAGYFTAACGLTIYTGNAWPEEYRGNAFVAEGAGNLIHRMRLVPNGVGFEAQRTEEKREFLTSEEIWFRPVQFTNAPDGTFYLADMYREIFEHPDAVPPSIKKYLDLNAGNDRGRIYRIVPEGFRQPSRVRLGDASPTELVRLLEHPNGWHRRTASRLLYERQDSRAVEPLVKLAAEASPLGRMHAMYALAAQGELSAEVLLARLDDPHPRVREHAVRLAEGVLEASPPVRVKLCAMVADEDFRVRYQLAYTLGELKGSQPTAPLAAIAARDAGDRWVRLAVLSSSLGRAGDIFSLLAREREWRAGGSGPVFLEQLAQQAGLEAQNDQVAAVLKAIESFSAAEERLTQVAVRGLSRGLEKSGSPLRKRLTSGNLARVLADLVEQSKTRAVDVALAVERRVEAIRSLALASFGEARDVLSGLLHSGQPQAVQVAAVQTLGRFRAAEVAEIVIAHWPGFSPQVRGEAVEVLFGLPERLSALLTAIEKEEISAFLLDPGRLQLLKGHPDNGIAHRATQLLGEVKLAGREDVVAQYRDVLEMKGDVARGREAFRKECVTCHKLEGFGYDLGLPLNSVKDRGEETILISVLDPNREVNPQYINYTVVTRRGVLMTGMVTAETATSVTLERGEGASDTVLRSEIAVFEGTGLSIMPEGLEQQLDKQTVADVISYLMAVE